MMGLINAPAQEQAVTMIGRDGKPVEYTPTQLSELDHASLAMLREWNADNKQLQQTLAPFEHQAFAREAAAENPALAVPIALATPLYAGAKAMGFMSNGGTATDPSFAQVGRGLIGVGQGVALGAKRFFK